MCEKSSNYHRVVEGGGIKQESKRVNYIKKTVLWLCALNSILYT